MIVLRALVRLVGFGLALLSGLLGIVSIEMYIGGDVSDRIMAGAISVIALLLFLFGVKLAFRHRGKATMAHAVAAPRAEVDHKRGYTDFQFGHPPPTMKQFNYAKSIGVAIYDGMSRWMLSDAITETIEEQRGSEPASKEQLQTIKLYHGTLKREINRGEARRIIEFLEEYELPCPRCRVPILATDQACCACNMSLRKLKIPIKLKRK